MKRRFRSTEICGEVTIPFNQWNKALFFCVNCHGVGHKEFHYGDCSKKESYAIPATASVPRRNASKRTWNIFMRQFVYVKPFGDWNYITWSWWYLSGNVG